MRSSGKTFAEREKRREEFTPLPDALNAARNYLKEKLGDRRGFRQVLDYLRSEDAELYQEVVKELAVEMEMFAKDCRTWK
jgi:hypothetical protein